MANLNLVNSDVVGKGSIIRMSLSLHSSLVPFQLPPRNIRSQPGQLGVTFAAKAWTTLNVGDLLSRDSGGKKGKPANVHLRKEQPIPAMFTVDAVGPALDYTAIVQHTMLREHTNEGERFV